MLIRRILILLLALTLALPGYAAVSKTGTPVGDHQPLVSDWETLDITFTAPADCTLLLVSLSAPAKDDQLTGIAWDPDVENEALALIDQTTNGGLDGDVVLDTWGLVSPTAKAAKVTLTASAATMATTTTTVVCYTGTVVSSLGDATNFISEDVDDGSEATLVMASGGSAGNLLYVVGAGNGANQTSDYNMDGSWVEVILENTADGSGETLQKVADVAAPSGITMTRAQGQNAEQAGHIIEIVAAVSTDDSTLRRRRE